ncbi:hypothetical protein [Brevibacillus brevis]|uniref:hypothetical protein n=1 Tax=Brevibacillus brevis TaxID=1393 RepID=UPI00115880EA|nr:hypothetical protein [Lysinibacillus sp. SDF0063]TQR29433.1 hypothetical protein C7Y45_28980 [Lysinibacillus sp. SDF0063]
MTKQYPTVVIDGKETDYEAFVHLMDDDLREELDSKLAPCSPQQFAEAYMIAHREKYGVEYVWG